VNAYYDTGIILKLYTEERESKAARTLVKRRHESIFLTGAHLAECTSALRLKQFRGECHPGQVAETLAHMEEDFESGLLKALPVDWDKVWQRCRTLSDAHAGATGCRTLDTLHVACATVASAAVFITSDHRQIALAELAGLHVINPFS
jgi:predicted nucleic acid-binding protein